MTTNVLHGRCLLSRVAVGRGLAPAAVELTPLGQIAEEQLLAIPQRYPFVQIGQYVIMPNHVHILFIFSESPAGASPRPTLMQVVGIFKSLTARLANRSRLVPGEKLWQTSFYESVLQSEKAIENARRYIQENPARWRDDPYFLPCPHTTESTKRKQVIPWQR